MNDQELYARAVAVAARAYAPYSNYFVGAAVLARDGRLIEGVNVENAAYPLGVCAERTALARAVAEGYRPGQLEAIAITASPCGGCRQWLHEFGLDRVTYEHRGVVTEDDWQLVLVDLPGFQRPRDALTEHMQRTVDASLAGDVDAVLFVLDARERIGAGDRFIASRVFSLGVPVVIAVSKVDRLKPGHIASQMQIAARLGDFHALHPVSGKTGDGIGELREELVALLPEGPLYYPPEQRSDLGLELQVAELVREKALHLTREEVPHAISVELEELGEKVVRAVIYVETESQKQIVVGKGGSVVKEIGVRARPEIEAILGHPVFLELVVKVKPRWRRDERMLERLGI